MALSIAVGRWIRRMICYMTGAQEALSCLHRSVKELICEWNTISLAIKGTPDALRHRSPLLQLMVSCPALHP